MRDSGWQEILENIEKHQLSDFVLTKKKLNSNLKSLSC